MKSLNLNDSTVQAGLATFFMVMKDAANEKVFRILLGAFAIWLGEGSISFLSRMAQTSRQRISRGIREIQTNDPIIRSSRIRREGGGRKRTEQHVPGIVERICDLINRSSYGNPENVKCRIYSAMSLLKMQKDLAVAGIRASVQTILRIVRSLGFTKQVNRKSLQIGKPHPDANTQMQIVTDVKNHMAEATGNPVVSVDAKAKEPLLNVKKKGREWRHKKDARKVEDHDFVPSGRKVTPYGVYDVGRNLGFLNLCIGPDTAQLAVESIRRWWEQMGRAMYPNADRITILCDGGGSNGWRIRLWKYELAKLASQIGLPIEVHHYPTGKSRFNPIEHRLFNHISMNWAGQPLTDLQTMLQFVCSTVTAAGLKVTGMIDEHVYRKGIKVSNDQCEQINIVRSPQLGGWNYTIYGLNEPAA